MTDDEARAQMGSPYGDAAVEISGTTRKLETEVQPAVERLLGRPPRCPRGLVGAQCRTV